MCSSWVKILQTQRSSGRPERTFVPTARMSSMRGRLKVKVSQTLTGSGRGGREGEAPSWEGLGQPPPPFPPLSALSCYPTGEGDQCAPTPGPAEERKPRGQNRDALGQRLCPAKPQPPQRRAWRPHLGADTQGIYQAFRAGPAASTDAAATDSGQDPRNTPRPLGTLVFSSKTQGKRPPRGEACMSTGLTRPPARQLPTACSAGPAWGRWTSTGSSSGHRRLSPRVYKYPPGKPWSNRKFIFKHCTAATKTHPKPEKFNRNYRNKNGTKELPSTA